jgi:hypothetical protein
VENNMSESVLGGIAAGDAAKSDIEGSASPASAAAFAAAIAHHASIYNPEVARDASAFLRGQLRHVDVQTEHLQEEHTLRPQSTHRHGRRSRQRASRRRSTRRNCDSPRANPRCWRVSHARVQLSQALVNTRRPSAVSSIIGVA